MWRGFIMAAQHLGLQMLHHQLPSTLFITIPILIHSKRANSPLPPHTHCRTHWKSHSVPRGRGRETWGVWTIINNKAKAKVTEPSSRKANELCQDSAQRSQTSPFITFRWFGGSAWLDGQKLFRVNSPRITVKLDLLWVHLFKGMKQHVAIEDT